MSWKGYGDRIRSSFHQLKARFPQQSLGNEWLGRAVAAAENPPRAEPYSPGTVSHWLTERHAPGLDAFEGLAVVFGHVLESGAPDPGFLAFALPLQRERAGLPPLVRAELPPALPLRPPPTSEPARQVSGSSHKRKRPR